MLKFYGYKKCQTCRNAQKWLDDHHIDYTYIPIRETPPSIAELQQMADYYQAIKPLVNISGQDYRAQQLKTQWGIKTDKEWLDLLHQNGNLVKRPFLIGPHIQRVGFKIDEWQSLT